MEVVVMAVTKMNDGFCIAGMTTDGRWIRLIPQGSHNWRSIAYNNREYIRTGDVLNVSGGWMFTDPPHYEDYKVKSMKRVNQLNNKQMLDFCHRKAEPPDKFFELMSRRIRSLCLLKADGVETVFKEIDPVKSRLAVRLGKDVYRNDTRKPGFPCTCLKWRAMQRQELELPVFNQVYTAFGLARPFTDRDGRFVPAAPMVISILSDPPLPGVVDYNQP